jgi:hypothetical protein
MNMIEQQPWRDAATDDRICDEIWLLGQPPLERYLDFVEEMVVDRAAIDRKSLTDEWRTANDYYDELAQTQSGSAEQVECRKLDPIMAALAEKVKADARYRHTFNTLPTHIGMVELDRLVVYQTHVTGNFIASLKARLGPAPDTTTLFNFCLPLEYPDAPVQIRQVGSKRYVFRSNSTDFRFQKSALLRPDQICDFQTFGPIAGIVGLVVGFGSNFLNVIRGENRLLLHNGYHRACALRALGITHAPCIIQDVTRLDELEISVKRDVAQNSAFYFKSPRPPLLRDFFDPKIRKVLPTHKMERLIEVNFEVRDYLVPA